MDAIYHDGLMDGGYIPFPTWLNPEIVPGLPLRWYGLMYLVAFYLTYRLLRVRIAERDLTVDNETVLNLFFWGIIGVLIGGRLISVMVYDPSGHYLRNPLQIIVPFAREGGKLRFVGLQGMAYHGGLLGAIVAVALYCRAKRLPVAEWMDMIADLHPARLHVRPARQLHQRRAVRARSPPCRGAWSFPAPPEFPADQAWVRQMAERSGIDDRRRSRRWSTWRATRRNSTRRPWKGCCCSRSCGSRCASARRFPGVLFSAYLIGYGIVRFAVEYVRQPDPGLDFPIMLVDRSPIRRRRRCSTSRPARSCRPS